MDVKSLLLIPGVLLLWVLAFGNKIVGLPELPIRLRLGRLILGIVALAFILTGAYWK